MSFTGRTPFFRFFVQTAFMEEKPKNRVRPVKRNGYGADTPSPQCLSLGQSRGIKQHARSLAITRPGAPTLTREPVSGFTPEGLPLNHAVSRRFLPAFLPRGVDSVRPARIPARAPNPPRNTACEIMKPADWPITAAKGVAPHPKSPHRMVDTNLARKGCNPNPASWQKSTPRAAGYPHPSANDPRSLVPSSWGVSSDAGQVWKPVLSLCANVCS